MLRRDQTGRRRYSVQDAQTISPRLLTEEQLTQQQLPPDLALTFPNTSWHRGIGAIRYQASDPDVLADGTRIDVTERGVIKLARDLTSPNLDSAPNEYVPSGFAVSGSQLWGFIGRDVYSWDWTNTTWDIGTEPVAAARIFRNGVSFDGRIYVPSWADDVGSGGSYVSADEPVNYLHKLISDAGWTLMANSGQTLEGPKYMAVADQKLWGGNFTSAADSTANVNGNHNASTTTLAVSDGTQFAVGYVIKVESEYMLVTAVVVNDLTVVRSYRGSAGATHANLTDVYIVTENVHHVRSTTNGSSYANWSTPTSIGDSGSPITALVSAGEQLVIIKTDGIYTLETDGTVTNRLPGGPQMGHANFGKGAWAWNNLVFIPLHNGGLWELETETWTIRDISFSLSLPDQSQYHGRVVAGAGNPGRLYVVVQESANTLYHIMMAQDPSKVGLSDYNWTQVGSITYTTGTDPDHAAAMVAGLTNGSNSQDRLWVGMESTAGSVKAYYLTNSTIDVADYFTATDGDAYTVAFDAGFPNVLKRAKDIVCNTDNLGAVGATNHHIDVRYRIDGGSWLYVHTGTGTNTDDGSTLVGDNQTINFTAGVTFRKIEFRFTFDRKSSGDGTSPELHDFTFTCQLRMTAIKLLPLSLYLANGMELNNRMVENRAITNRNQLRTWNTGASEVVLTDTELGTRNMVFLPGHMVEREISKLDGRFPEYQVDVLLAEVG